MGVISVGGMALSVLVPATVQALCLLARDPTDALHVWALHGLWLTAEAAGLSYVPHVQVGIDSLLYLKLLLVQLFVRLGGTDSNREIFF